MNEGICLRQIECEVLDLSEPRKWAGCSNSLAIASVFIAENGKLDNIYATF